MTYDTGSTSCCRVRDIAYAVKDTAAAFGVSWDNGVVIAKGGAYTAEPIAASTMPPAVTETTLTAVVDGQTVEVPAAVMTPGNYCVTAEGLASLLGVSVALTDGVLTITTAA